MAIYKRGKTWWTDFSVNGQRYRESLRVTDWREAQAREKELIVQASPRTDRPIEPEVCQTTIFGGCGSVHHRSLASLSREQHKN